MGFATYMQKTLFIAMLAIGLAVLGTEPVLAHQPRVNQATETMVADPEVSKAYYGQLSGQAHTYTIEAKDSFDLYIGILVPDAPGAAKDVTAEIFRGDEQLASIGGPNAEWKNFFEPFGRSAYWDGGEYEARAEAGNYRIVVKSPNYDSKYSLAVGKIESFNMSESWNAIKLIPELKKNFFAESPAGFILSPFGFGYIIIMYVLAFIFGLAYRFVLKKMAAGTPRGLHKNIGKKDRIGRLVLGIGLLLLAITTSWSSILLFFSGFTIFEALFSWCGFYAALGKNTCPINL